MSLKVSYVTIRTFISDYKSGKKSEVDIMHGKLIEDKSSNTASIELLSTKGVLNITIQREGDDLLAFRTFFDDNNDKVLSQGKSLNQDYKESVTNRSILDKGIIADTVQVELDNSETMSIKTLRDERTLEVIAVIREMHIPITEKEYSSLKKKI